MNQLRVKLVKNAIYHALFVQMDRRGDVLNARLITIK